MLLFHASTGTGLYVYKLNCTSLCEIVYSISLTSGSLNIMLCSIKPYEIYAYVGNNNF